MAETRSDQDWQEIISDLLPSVEDKTAVEYPAYPEPSDLASYIDHTLLKLDATPQQIDQLCEEAKQHNFKVTMTCLRCDTTHG